MKIGLYNPERGYWEAIDPKPSYLASLPPKTVEVPIKPSSNYVLENGQWEEQPMAQTPLTPTGLDVNRERQRRIEVGKAFTVAGVADQIPLQGRPFDQTVYLALLTRASGYKSAGVTDPVLKIRAGDDTIHMLTPDQMISLVSQAMTWFEAVMAASWSMKDNGIPADYTDDKHWP